MIWVKNGYDEYWLESHLKIEKEEIMKMTFKGIGSRQRTIMVTLAISVFFLVSSFGMAAEWPPPVGKKELTIAKGPWASADLCVYIAKPLLEKMGYTVNLPSLTTGPAWEALANGSADLFPNGFLPGQNPHFNKYFGKIDLLVHSYLPVSAGLIVPSYVSISSIAELKKPEVKAKFEGKILGADPGTGTWIDTERAVKAYDLDYKIIPGSAATIFAVFKKANDKGDWVVGMAWHPDAIWGKMNIKFLDDPKGIYPFNTDFHVVRRGFREDFPRATVFFSRFTLAPSIMSKYLAILADDVAPAKVGQMFIDEHPEEVYYWVYDLIKDYPKPASLK